MKIYRKNSKIIIELETKQPSYDALDEYIENVPNIVGVLVHSYNDDNADFEQGIYQLNELGYKDDVQLGMPLVMTYMDNKEFKKLCKKIGIDVWEYNKCAKCNTTLYGSHTINNKGQSICISCDR